MKYLDLTGLSHFKDKIVALLNNKQDILTGGTTRQVLTKNSSTNGDLSWQDRDTVISPTKPITNERIWFKYSRNIFDFNTILPEMVNNTPSASMENITIDYTNKTISINPIANDIYFPGIWNNKVIQNSDSMTISVEQNTDYTISLQCTNFTNAKCRIYGYTPSTGTYNSLVSNILSSSITFNTGNYDHIALRIGIQNSDTNAVTFNNIKIEKGSTATSYEDYVQPSILIDGEEIYNKQDDLTGGTQRQILTKNSSINGDMSWQDRDVIISPTKPTTNERVWFKYGGKNLFNISSITVGYWVNSLGQYNPNAGWNIGEKVKVKPNTDYTMSREETTGAFQVGIAEYDENNDFIQQQAQWQTGVNSKTFTTSATTKYVRPMYNKTYSMTNIQFEEGSIATTYEPYTNPSILIDNEEIYNKNDFNILTRYSITEQQTGQIWIDGKPIYRKVIDIGSLPSSGDKLVPHGLTIANVNIIKIYGIAKSGNVYLPLPNVASDNNDDGMFVTEGNILIHVESNRSSFTGYAILEYTKTTD